MLWGDGPLALVLVPTKELAQQIEKEVKVFSHFVEGFKIVIVIGGTNIYDQRSELKGGVEVVATLSQFINHLQQGNNFIYRVSYVVLEVDLNPKSKR
jgi:ATP-dependent RNA helicase DDX5/DBP2